ncbi:MAG: tRNA uridine-5-carboxymethylaminomethyl(34) synthesis GTPase MnmE, partial [Oscillospiraceae bacterium]
IVAIATPPGAGGVAMVRLSGPQSCRVAGKIFQPKNAHKNLEKMPGYSAAYGRFVSRGKVLDDGIALCFRAPNSYTGEEMVELTCHGSDTVARLIVEACVESGARPAGPGEFTRRAFLNGRMDLTQAEAVMDLVAATSRQGALAAEAALGGALHKKTEEMKARLLGLAAHLAAYVDYPEEGVEQLSPEAFCAVAGDVRDALAEMICDYDRGMVVRRGVRAAIVGSPNVGKSTLFNLLSGFERTIVTPQAGTTRDVVRETIQVGGVCLRVSDTAGLHAAQDVIEQEGIRRSYEELKHADLVLAVFDGSETLDAAGLELAEQCRGRRALGIINKSDLGTVLQPEALAPYFSAVVAVSAKRPETVEVIERAVVELLDVGTLDTDAAMIANQRQLQSAVAARDALEAGITALEGGFALDAAGVCLDDALAALAELTGERVSERIIDEVFANFCVGK